MPILIDGHNLIGHLATLSLTDPNDEEKLVRSLQSWRARTGKSITVVFDPGVASGIGQTQRIGGIRVIFASPGSSADEVIVRRIKQSRNPRGWQVVTSDRELAERVAHLGARVQTAEAFANRLEQPGAAPLSQKEVPPSPEEVDRWLDLFQDHDRPDSVGSTD